MDYQKLLTEIKLIAIAQGELLEKALRSPESVTFKTKEDEVDKVTELDNIIEERFVEVLSEKFPEMGFILEEHSELNDATKEFTCYIDPIDGTKYFAKDMPLFAISVGVLQNGEPVAGAIYNPVSEQFYAGAEGIPTTLNGREVRVSEQTDISKALLSLDMVKRDDRSEMEKEWMIKKMNDFYRQAYRIRIFGQGALSCAWVASGGWDGYVSVYGHAEKPFDIAAGKALIKYAQGKIVDLQVPGVEHPRFVGGNPILVDQICELLLN